MCTTPTLIKTFILPSKWLWSTKTAPPSISHRRFKRLIIGATRNWSRNVLEWNLAADPDYKPYTDRGGCPMCQGAVTIDKNAVKETLLTIP